MTQITEDLNLSKAAKRDIVELQNKIELFRNGQIAEEKFKAYRLTRGVYGQRQQGVQMFRLKIPAGRITTEQLRTVAALSEQYATGNLHLTTRQNIQLHHVKLDDSPAIWTALEAAGLTAREACGNTVRNITASHKAGIDPHEPFDVTPYLDAVFRFFLRNPICQEMGRKIKIAFSSSEKDTAFAFIHDFGFIPILKKTDKGEEKGFRVLVGGGLGAQTILAQEFFDFLPEDRLINFLEAALRVFDRYGEREKRMKARLKFLIKNIGLEEFRKLVEEEEKVLHHKPLELKQFTLVEAKPQIVIKNYAVQSQWNYQKWLDSNVFEQKQEGYYGVLVKAPLGNIDHQTAIKLADTIDKFVGGDLVISVYQGLVIRFVKKDALPVLFEKLGELGLNQSGAESFADITACPGTDTCNLGVTNSTAIATVLENFLLEEYPHLANSKLINTKISGCMNACGQHMIAGIGLHGSSIKNAGKVVPAMQVVLGGGLRADGTGLAAEKVIKLPTKRIPQAFRVLLNDYEKNANQSFYPDYFREQGKKYFYDLLKHLGDLSEITDAEYIDWNHKEEYVPEIGVGECAGVSFDLVSTIFSEAEEKLNNAYEHLSENRLEHAIYNSYNVLVTTAKALLLAEDIQCNTQVVIIEDFDTHFVETRKVELNSTFEELVYQIKVQKPSEEFAGHYLKSAHQFLDTAKNLRGIDPTDKSVINHFYKA
jgi:sulfite reductase (ferredoxin)